MDAKQIEQFSDQDFLQQREISADYYAAGHSLTSPRFAFKAGWDSAIQKVAALLQTPGSDGCYCAHHPDDPAHTKDCYDLVKALTGR